MPTRQFFSQVALRLAPDDGMYSNNDAHYLSCGASALNAILAALQTADTQTPTSILDFGAGAGRVTRWLRVAFPEARLAACDVRERDMSFCRKEFNAETWLSGTDVDALTAPQKYDLIWVGSVITHLSSATSAMLIRKLFTWTNAGGLVVVSTHGRYARTRQDSGALGYIDPARWAAITKGYDESGFGYADYANESGYGVSLTKLSWLAALIEGMPQARLVMLSERAWDGHHDVFAIQNNAIALVA